MATTLAAPEEMGEMAPAPEGLPPGAMMRPLKPVAGMPLGALLRPLKASQRSEKAPQKMTHPAGEVTGIDEATGLPIVRRPQSHTAPHQADVPRETQSSPEKQMQVHSTPLRSAQDDGAREVIQGSADAGEIRRSAAEQEPGLRAMAQEVVKHVPGAKLEGSRVKDAESQRTKTDRGKPPETNIDNLGARLSAKSLSALEKLKLHIRKRMPVENEDKITQNGLDLHQFGVKTGGEDAANRVSEVQVGLKPQIDAMKETEPLYEKQKEAEAGGDTAEAARLGAQITAAHRAASGVGGAKNSTAGTAGWSGDVPLKGAGRALKAGDVVTFKDGRAGVVRFSTGRSELLRLRVRLANGTVLNSVRPGDVKPVTVKAPDPESEWYGSDLDGTLAEYHGFEGLEKIGPPVGRNDPDSALNTVKRWISEGKDVRILSARIAHDPKGEGRAAIEAWTEQYLGKALPATETKDSKMVKLLDDRAVQVEENTGKLVGGRSALDEAGDAHREASGR